MKNNSWLIRGARKMFRNEYYVKDSVILIDIVIIIITTIILFRVTVLNVAVSYLVSFLAAALLSTIGIYILSFFEGNNRYWQKRYFEKLMRNFNPELN